MVLRVWAKHYESWLVTLTKMSKCEKKKDAEGILGTANPANFHWENCSRISHANFFFTVYCFIWFLYIYTLTKVSLYLKPSFILYNIICTNALFPQHFLKCPHFLRWSYFTDCFCCLGSLQCSKNSHFLLQWELPSLVPEWKRSDLCKWYVNQWFYQQNI